MLNPQCLLCLVCNTFLLILIIGSQDHVLQSFSLKLMLSKPGSTSDEIFWSSPSLGEDPREDDGGLFAVFILFVPCIQKKIQQDQGGEI